MTPEELTIIAIKIPDDVDRAASLEFHRWAMTHTHVASTRLHLSPDTLVMLSPEQDELIASCFGILREFSRARAIVAVSDGALVLEHEQGPPVFIGDGLGDVLQMLEDVEEGSVVATSALRQQLDRSRFEFQVEDSREPSALSRFVCTCPEVVAPYIDPDARNQDQMERWAKQVTNAIREGLTGESPASLDMLLQHADSILDTIEKGTVTAPASVAEALVALRLWLNPLWMRPIALEATQTLLERDMLDGPLKLELRELHAAQLKKLGQAEESIEEHTALLDEPSPPAVIARCFIALSELHFMRKDMDLALEYSRRAIDFCGEHDLGGYQALAHQGVAEALIGKATCIDAEGTAAILKEFEKSVAVAQASKDLQAQLIALGEWSNFSSINTPEKSLENLKRVKELATMLRIEHFVSMALIVMGDISLRLKRPDLARDFLSQTRARLDEDDRMGQWHAQLQEAMIYLYEQNYEQATRHTTLLEESSERYDHWMGMVCTTRLFMLIALMMEQFERFDLIIEGKQFDDRSVDETICMLRELLTDRQNKQKRDALVERLEWHQKQALYHEWLELVWRKAIAHFPDTFVPLRIPDTLAVHAEQGWFICREQPERVELAHRPYLHRMFKELLLQHEKRGKGIDTLDLFDACWPDETVSFEVMKNRVYVGISNLRKLGLRPWLVRLPDGYTLSESLDVIPANPAALE